MGVIKNLDKLVREDVKFILQAKEYVVPGQVSVRDRLRIASMSQKALDGDVDAMEGSIEAFLDVIAPANPGLDREMFKGTLTMEQLTALFNLLNTPDAGNESEDPGKNGSGADLTK